MSISGVYLLYVYMYPTSYVCTLMYECMNANHRFKSTSPRAAVQLTSPHFSLFNVNINTGHGETPNCPNRPILIYFLLLLLLLPLLLLLLLLLLPLYHTGSSSPWCVLVTPKSGEAFSYLFAIPFRRHSYLPDAYSYVNSQLGCFCRLFYTRSYSTQPDWIPCTITAIPTRPSMPDPARMRIHTYIHTYTHGVHTEYIHRRAVQCG